MSSINLLNINVDTLFEQHSIAEIDQIQKKVQMEVEQKREELRTMVGERYRDLLKAADTIAVMKKTSGSVIGQVENILTNLKNLNEQQLVGFKTEPQTTSVASNKLNNYYSTVVKIKLLTDMPELIWTSIDDEQFFVATELFVFARHISTGLQLETDNKFLRYFPVAKKQWEIIKPFAETLKKSCTFALERDTLTPEAATDCLLSLCLLERAPLDQLFTNFIELRTKAFLNTLSNDRNSQKRVKDRIMASLEILNSTVELIYKCFFDNEKGLLIEQIEVIASDSKPPTITLMNLNDQAVPQVLPDLIAKFKPTFNIQLLSMESVKSSIGKWLEDISSVAKTQLRELFECVSSMKIIQEIRKDSQTIKKHSKWIEMCEALSLRSQLDFYEQEYQPLLNERMRDIVRHSWSICVNAVYDEIKEMLKSSSKQPDSGIYDLWIEDPLDIPLSIKHVLSLDTKSNVLLMKTKGYSPEIVKICSSFDNRLETIFSEVNVYLEDDGSKIEEKQLLLEYLKDISQEQTLELITKIKTFNFERNCKDLVLLGRLFVSFIDLCPNFKLCLSYSYTVSSWEKISVDKKNFEKWNKVCNLLEDEAFAFFKQFCDVLINDVHLDGICRTNLDLDTILKDFVNWETLTVEEKDEQDNPVQSTIKIPSQPRISVQTYLVKIIDSLNKYVPQTLPRKVLLYLDARLTKDFFRHFRALVNENFVTTNQNVALQLYFDLKFLKLFFVARDDKKTSDDFQQLTNSLKSFVDPFDFELFYSYMNMNVQKCAQRMQHEFGVLLPYPENIGMPTDIKQTAGTLDKDPNVLSLSSNGSSSTWFPLLPIIISENKSKPLVHHDVEKTPSSVTKTKKSTEIKASTSQHLAQNYASNVKSGAAAFFGAMSQDWFR